MGFPFNGFRKKNFYFFTWNVLNRGVYEDFGLNGFEVLKEIEEMLS